MFQNKEEFCIEFSERIIQKYGRSFKESHINEKYDVLGTMIRDYASTLWKGTKDDTQAGKHRQVVYFSMEFLLGRLMKNNLMNLGIYKIAEEGLADLGISLDEIIEKESDAGLGNGGLGRLAACFMDSLPSLRYPAYGNSIRYEYGFFRQVIENGHQTEVPDQWLSLGNVWEIRKPKHAVEVSFWGRVEPYLVGKRTMYRLVDAEHIRAVPYDMPMIGANNHVINTLRLWSAEPSGEQLPKHKDFYTYLNETRQLCHGLYPDDSTEAGKLLRLKQQYFFVSAGLQSYIKDHLRHNPSLDNFTNRYVFQLNDTHPVLAIPELMRLLLDVHSYEWEDAWQITTSMMAYTNHTVMREALESWPVHTLQLLLPRIYTIIEEINRRFLMEVKTMTNDSTLIESVSIIQNNQVQMANLAIVGSFRVNGVATLHTQILTQQVFQGYFQLFPDKFVNITNGVTHRRFLSYSNPSLSQLISDTIGSEWINHPDYLSALLPYAQDPAVQASFLTIKSENKKKLAAYVREKQGVNIDINSIFDVHIKRLHAYKRQLLNLFHIIWCYQRLMEDSSAVMIPRTFIFAAKAAPSYVFAKDVISLIHAVAEVINHTPRINQYLRVVFIENYDVTKAELIIPAADVSEQISTAGKEASGTGNMKLMMNGAITLGTLDGANVEIHDLVGDDNCVIFGHQETELADIAKDGSYQAMKFLREHPELMRVVNTLIDGTFGHNRDAFRSVYDELILKNDEFYVLLDFPLYLEAQQKVERLYQQKALWAKIGLTNIAQSGYFSSDRTIEEYVKYIWKLSKIK